MRSAPKILLLLAVTGALWLLAERPVFVEPELGPTYTDPATEPVQDAAPPAAAEAPDAPGGRRTAEVEVPPEVPLGARDRGSADARSGHPQEGEGEDFVHLDRASEQTIRDTLAQAVEREQRDRPLYLSPGLIETAAREREVRVVFDLQALAAGAPHEAMAHLLSGPADARWQELRVFPLLSQGAAAVGPQALLHLIESGRVEHIEIDAVHRPSLTESVPMIGADLAQQLGHDGDGVVIAILDTGIDGAHPMLAGRIVDEACFSLAGDCPNGQTEMFGPGAGAPCDFGCNHGTRVAGIAAGADAGDGLVGVAPGASLVSIQIFSEVGGEAGAYSSDILAALQHVLTLRAFYPIAVANLSFGGTLFNSEESCDRGRASQRSAIALLRDAGIAAVAASGNEQTTNALASPACLSNVISVGSVSSDDAPSSFSNSASFLSLLAPGESIESSAMGGGTDVGSGTSMATPHVAGAIAAMREAVPIATVDEIENALALSGVPVLDGRNGYTFPRIRLPEAIALLASTATGTPAAAAPGGGSGGAAVASAAGGGGGSSCGLVGLEPLAVLAGLHGFRRLRRETRARPA